MSKARRKAITEAMIREAVAARESLWQIEKGIRSGKPASANEAADAIARAWRIRQDCMGVYRRELEARPSGLGDWPRVLVNSRKGFDSWLSHRFGGLLGPAGAIAGHAAAVETARGTLRHLVDSEARRAMDMQWAEQWILGRLQLADQGLNDLEHDAEHEGRPVEHIEGIRAAREMLKRLAPSLLEDLRYVFPEVPKPLEKSTGTRRRSKAKCLQFGALVWQEDGKLQATFPDVPGCHTFGDTLDDVMTNAREALQGNLEARLESGLGIPEPSLLDQFEGTARQEGKALMLVPVSLEFDRQ